MVILLLGNKTRKRGRDRDRERDKDREEAEDDDLIYQEWNGGEITMTNWPQALIFIVRKVFFFFFFEFLFFLLFFFSCIYIWDHNNHNK